MVGNPKMDPPHIKTSCGTQNENSNPMRIGLGIDYITWWEILKCNFLWQQYFILNRGEKNGLCGHRLASSQIGAARVT